MALMWATFNAVAQTDTIASNHKYKVKTNTEKVGDEDLFTGDYYKDKFGNLWMIYRTPTNKYYVHRKSKNGNWYKMYVEKGGEQ